MIDLFLLAWGLIKYSGCPTILGMAWVLGSGTFRHGTRRLGGIVSPAAWHASGRLSAEPCHRHLAIHGPLGPQVSGRTTDHSVESGARRAFKIGLRHPEGWAAYVLGDHLFIKSVPLIDDATYPDMGSNFETFTNSEFLELETLGPLQSLSAGEVLVHTESWVVFPASLSRILRMRKPCWKRWNRTGRSSWEASNKPAGLASI